LFDEFIDKELEISMINNVLLEKETNKSNLCSLRPEGILQRTKPSDFAEDEELAKRLD
jgi:hypothetical protein